MVKTYKHVKSRLSSKKHKNKSAKKALPNKNTKEYYNKIVKSKVKLMKKTDLLAYMLSKIMRCNGIKSSDYMIIAGYCLKEYRDVSDLDVVMTQVAYKKLRLNLVENGDFMISKSKISGDERIVIPFPDIDNNTEIEISGKNIDIGFPSNKYSMKTLSDNNGLTTDKYGNRYLNIDTCIEFYSDVVKNEKGEYVIGTFTIPRERVLKNIGLLQKILANRKDKSDVIKEKISYLTSLL